jgi:hypothetical protein
MLSSYEEELRQEREKYKRDSDNSKHKRNGMGPPPYHSYHPPPNFYWDRPAPYPPMPMPYQPWQYPREKKSVFTVVGLTFGIIVICMFWTAIFPGFFGTTLLIVVIIFGIISIIFGVLGYQRKKEDLGLVAIILAIVAIILSIIFWLFTHVPDLYNYGYEYIHV